MRKLKTRFEQVPLELVKKIIEKQQEARQPRIKTPNLVVETPATKTEPYSIPHFVNCRKPA